MCCFLRMYQEDTQGRMGGRENCWELQCKADSEAEGATRKHPLPSNGEDDGQGMSKEGGGSMGELNR